MFSRTESFMIIGIVLLVLAVLFSSVIGAIFFQDTVTAKIIRLERVNNKESSKYLIFTEKETFENTDTLLFTKFDSSDLYGKLIAGKTYRLRVYGFRIPLFSMYRNIVEVTEVSN